MDLKDLIDSLEPEQPKAPEYSSDVEVIGVIGQMHDYLEDKDLTGEFVVSVGDIKGQFEDRIQFTFTFPEGSQKMVESVYLRECEEAAKPFGDLEVRLANRRIRVRIPARCWRRGTAELQRRVGQFFQGELAESPTTKSMKMTPLERGAWHFLLKFSSNKTERDNDLRIQTRIK
jgi:hypothetical protein